LPDNVIPRGSRAVGTRLHGDPVSYTIQQIALHVGGEIIGDAHIAITGVERMERATRGQITFVRDSAHARHWPRCQASAALVDAQLDLPLQPDQALVRVSDADQAMAQVLAIFAPPVPTPPPGVHPAAVVDPSAQLGAHVAIGPCAVIGPNARIGDGCVIHANVTIFEDAVIGEQCVIWSGTVIRERCRLGKRCIVHSNVTIGSDGFGYLPSEKGLVKIVHIGMVHLGDDVEIGAGTCIDRGKFAATEIGDGTKIDNLCQIAHNCCIGKHVAIAGRCGLAGSVTVGDEAILGGNVGVRDQITIGRGARIAAYAAVAENVPDGATWAGYPAQDVRNALRETIAIRKLPEIIRQWQKMLKKDRQDLTPDL